MKRTRNLKLPNGFGSIIYLGNNRRKPYGALKTFGWEIKDNEKVKQIKKYIGFGATWNEAYEILLNYNNMPFNLDNKKVTLQACYDKFITNLEEKYKNGKTSKSTYYRMISTWDIYLSKLANKKIIELNKKDFQTIINESGLKYTGRNYIRILINSLIETAKDSFDLSLNYDLGKLDVGEVEKSNLHKIFTTSQIATIEKLAEKNDIAKVIVIYLYTGWRPSELLSIKIGDVNLDNMSMTGGIKTDNGINRVIPIHSKIIKYVKYFYNINNEYLITIDNKHLNYDAYKKRFGAIMELLGFDHTPHDTRHTFVTRADEVGIPVLSIKILVGHSLAGDVTNIYIHKTIENLRKEVEKINYNTL